MNPFWSWVIVCAALSPVALLVAYGIRASKNEAERRSEFVERLKGGPKW